MSDNQVRVLVVDDGRDNREFITDYVLRPHGFAPLLARDGLEGMEMVRQHGPDIMLLDLQMPRMNGLQVLDALQAEGYDIPVILMTFHGSEEIAIEVFRKGVRDYVKKPYTVEEMLGAIDRALSEVRLRREKDALTERLLQGNNVLNRRIRELNTLYTIGKSVTALMGMDDLLPRIVDAATQVTGAEQGSVLLLEGKQLMCRAMVRPDDARAHTVHDYSSDPVAWQAVQSGEPVVIAPDEVNPLGKLDPTLPAAVISIPLKIGRRVVGVLSVANDAGARPFTKQDGAMLSALGDYAAIAIENARIYAALEEMTARQTENIRAAFERYVAPSVVDRVLQNPDLMRLGGQRREISVFFADVRGFTTFSEQAEPEGVLTLLNEYFKLATNIIFSREGTLDKFQGDAVMAFFNAPEDQPDHAYRAADAAMALQRAVAERNLSLDGEALTFGVGVHLGEVVVGNVGTDRAMNYTAIGDTVNVAKRLQERALPGQVLITAQIYDCIYNRVEAKSVGDLTIKGRREPVQVFELLALS